LACRGSSAVPGETATVMARTVTLAELEAPLYAADVAMTLTDKLLGGGVDGAV